MPGGQNTGITATGTTIIGLDVEEFEPDYIDTDLEIEEVYLESGDQVEAGTAMKKPRKPWTNWRMRKPRPRKT